MKILAFSDWRVQPINRLTTLLKQIEEDYDLLLYGGDDIHRLIEDGVNRFHELAQIADAELGFVRGNDDYPAGVIDLETDLVHDLHRNPIERSGYLFLGLEGGIGESAMGWIQYSEDQAASHLQEQYSNHDSEKVCLVSHNPPYGSLDFAQRFSNKRIGSNAVREFAEEVEPVFLLCGHVHQFGGQTKQTDYTQVVNAASHDHEAAEARIATIELQEDSVQVTHTTVTDQLKQVVDTDTAGSGVFNDLQVSSAELRKLTQIGSARGELLQKHGFHTISDIASVNTQTIAEACEIHYTVAERVLNHAKAFEENKAVITDHSRYQQLRDEEPVLLDIETNLQQDRVWCVGVYSYRDGEFQQFVELDDEEKLCSNLYDYIVEQGEPPVCYYAGQRFDERALTEVANRHDIPLDSVLDEWIDLCLDVRKTVFVPRNGHDLEKVAEELGYEFAYPGITGLEVGSVYSAYLSEGEHPQGGWDRYLEYNRDDAFAVKHVIEVAAGELDPGESAAAEKEGDHSIGEVLIEAHPESVLEIIRGLQKDPDSIVFVDSLMETATDLGIEPSVVEEALDGLKQEGMVYEPEPGKIRVTLLETSQNQSPAQGQSSSVDLTGLEDRAIKPEIPEIPGEDEVRCSLCEAVRAEEEVKTTAVRGNTRHFCRGGCDKEDDTSESEDSKSIAKGMVVERVECNGCSKVVAKSEATEKYRINDGATVWYCDDC